MAPDAERQRSQDKASLLNSSESGSGESVEIGSPVIFKDLSELRGNLIAIDGVVYNLDGFHHPGGDQIKLFSGNDVTIQYKMIHPSHNAGHLRKLTVVGKLDECTCSSEYEFDTPFEKELKSEVFKIVKRGQEFGTNGYIARAIAYIFLYFSCLYLWITHESTWTLAITFGLAHALIGLNVQHDANHGAASRKPFINDLLGFGVDLIGGSKWLWMQQHWTHHA